MEASLKSVTAALGTLRVGAADSEERLHEQAAEAFARAGLEAAHEVRLAPRCRIDFMVGGVGAFIGDLLFYPTPMFVSLVTHGLQAVVISLATRRLGKDRPSGSAIGVAIGAVIMVVGYSLGRAFIYSTPEYALLKLPFQIAQAVVGAVVGWLLCWKCKIAELYEKRFGIMS